MGISSGEDTMIVA